MDKNIFLKNSSGETLNPATSSLKVTAFSVSSLNNYTDLVVYLPHGLIEFNVYGKSQQDNVYSITIGLPDDTRKNLYAMFGEILRTGTGAAKNNGNSETYMFTYNLAIGSTAGTLLIKLNKPITILTTSTITFTTNLNKFVTPSALGVLDGTDTNDTQPVHIDGTGKLWTAPTGGGGEVVVDPIGGLQETASGLGIKRDGTVTGTSGLSVTNNGIFASLATDGTRGTIIGTQATPDMTQPVGITNAGKLVTKPGASEITIDPNGGLQNTSNGLSIKGDSSGAGGAGIVVGSGGTYIPIASGGTRGGIIGANKLNTQTEPVGIGADGKIYTNPIPKYTINPLNFYLDPENGNNSNDGLTIDTPLKTFSALIAKTPEFITQVAIYVTGTLTGDLSINKHIDNVYIASTSQDNFNLNGTIWNQFSKNITLRRVTIDPSVKTLFRTSCDCSYNLVDCTFNQTYDNSTDSPSDKSLIKATMQCGRIGVNIQGGQFDINALLFASSFVQLLDISLLTPNSASKIAKNLSNNTIGINKTGQIHQVILPEESLMTNMTMPTVYTGARESYIITGNNIMPFQTTNTASDSFTNVYTNIIQGLKLNGQFVQAQFSFYGTTTKALTISDASTVLGTSSGLKGSFVAIGMMNYNAQKYPVFVQVNNSGNIELYRVGLDSITIESGKTINISAIAVSYGGAV